MGHRSQVATRVSRALTALGGGVVIARPGLCAVPESDAPLEEGARARGSLDDQEPRY
jgi:hypothetical protein